MTDGGERPLQTGASKWGHTFDLWGSVAKIRHLKDDGSRMAPIDSSTSFAHISDRWAAEPGRPGLMSTLHRGRR